MTVFTSQLRQGSLPVLVREGFSFAAAIFGFLWLLWQRAWVPAALDFALLVLINHSGGAHTGALFIGLMLLRGCFGRDLVRWSWTLRGYTDGPIVAARDSDSAFARLLTERGDLFPDLGAALR